MKLELIKDLSLTENIIKIFYQTLDLETQEIIDVIEKNRRYLHGFQDKRLYLIDPRKVLRIFSENKAVFIETKDGIFKSRHRLYHFEEMLDQYFIKISQGELVNIRAIRELNMSLPGNIEVVLSNGQRSFVARRRLKAFKKALQIGGKRYENT